MLQIKVQNSSDESLDTIFFTRRVTESPEYPDWNRINRCYNVDLLAAICNMYKIHIEWINC